MRCRLLLGVLIGLLLVGGVLAVSDTAVFQGQYFEGNKFQEGTYSFTFNVYDDKTAGTICFSDSKNLTTGFWGQWRTELTGISVACNDTTKDYFMEIIIDGNLQTPRRQLTHFNYLRKNVDETTTGDLTISSILNFLLGGYIQEFTNYFLISKNLNIMGDINASGNITSDGKLVCLEDGTNCQAQNFTDTNCSVDGSCELITYDSELNYTADTSAFTECNADELLLGNGSCISSSKLGGGSSIQYVSFISTIDGNLAKNDRYLPLGTDSGTATEISEARWIIDRDLTITEILWNSKSNTRTKTSAITLMKNGSPTSLSKDIKGIVSGSDTSFSVSFSKGDLAAIKYESGGNGGKIEDLSIALIGTYD